MGTFAACGRQVTPNPPGLGAGGAPPGYTAFLFDVQAPFNFSSYQYMFVLNTSGNGITPSTDAFQTNWAGYMYALVAAGNGGTSYARVIQFVPSKQNPHSPPGWYSPGTTPQQFSYNLNNNGTGTELSMLAQRSIFTGLTSPSHSASPSNVWTFNAFTIQAGASGGGQWYFVDSLGTGGPLDPQFDSPKLCMTQPFDNIYAAYYVAPDQSAQIASIEIANNPASPAPCP